MIGKILHVLTSGNQLLVDFVQVEVFDFHQLRLTCRIAPPPKVRLKDLNLVGGENLSVYKEHIISIDKRCEISLKPLSHANQIGNNAWNLTNGGSHM